MKKEFNLKKLKVISGVGGYLRKLVNPEFI
jgi:hypothetical protein